MKRLAVTITGIALLLTACTAVGPDYRRPDFPVSASFASLEPGVSNSEPVTERAVHSWWKAFGDPTLERLMARAIARNHDLRIATARLQQARAQAMASASLRFPEGGVQSAYERVRTSEVSRFGAPLSTDGENPAQGMTGNQYGNLFLAGLDASWEIDVFGGVTREIEAALATLGAYEENLRDALVTLQGEVALNYLEVRGLQSRIEIAQRLIEARRSYAEIADARAKAGLVSHVDAVRARAEFKNAEAHIPALERMLMAAVHRLGVLLGQEPGSLRDELLADSLRIPPVPDDVPVGLPSDLVRRRPDIRRAERELAAATANIGVATADLFPRFSLTGTFGFQSNRSGTLFHDESNFWRIGPSIRWPILNFKRLLAQLEVSRGVREETVARYEQTVLHSFEEVENALVAIAREKRRALALAESARDGELAVSLALERYRAGIQSYQEVIDAQTAFYASEDELAQCLLEQALAFVRLYKALGGGWQYTTNIDTEGGP